MKENYSRDLKTDKLAKKALKDILTNTLRHHDKNEDMYVNGIKGLNTKYSDDFLTYYQTEGVEIFLDKKRVLIADDMGVGKTAQAIGGKLEMENRYGRKAKALVVVPNSLKNQWYDRIQEYCERPQTTEILNGGDNSEGLKKSKDADFTIINYEAFGQKNGNGKLTEELMSLGFDYVILDEVHNTKNPKSYRSEPIKKLADSAEHLCLLSGTPIPNNLKDTYMLISLLEPENYPTADSVRRAHWNQPGIIRSVLFEKRLKRKIGDVTDLPPISYNTGEEGVLELSPDQRDVYDAVYENDQLTGGRKLEQLRKALLDPSLVNPDIIFDPQLRDRIKDIQSAKYQALDKIIEEKTSRGEKVVIFSTYKNGVTDSLEKRYSSYGILRIDGDVSDIDERYEIVKDFQTKPEKKVLIGTTATTGEGLDFTAANNVVFLDEPYTPAARDQAVSRVYRRGQARPVNVISLSVKDSIDEGILELLRLKREGLEFMEKGMPLTSEQRDALDRDLSSESYKALVGNLESPIAKRMYSGQQKSSVIFSQMKGRGSEKNIRSLKLNDWNLGEELARYSLEGWESSYSGNTARAYKKVIEGLSKITDLGRKVDLGSGPGMLSHTLNEPTVNVDINPKNFDQGFAHPDCKNVEASLHDLSEELHDESFDLVVSSLSFDYTLDKSRDVLKTNDITRSERENSVREANRILRDGGYFILNLPYFEVDDETSKNLERGISKLGFDVVPEVTGQVRSDTDNVDFQVYMGVFKKVRKPSEKSASSQLRLVEHRGKREYQMRNRGVVEDFVFVEDEEEKNSLESRIRSYLKRIEVDKIE